MKIARCFALIASLGMAMAATIPAAFASGHGSAEVSGDLDAQFKSAAERVKNLDQRPTDDEMLEIYALYKQATAGDCNTKKPAAFKVAKKAMWKAWNDKAGMPKNEAKAAYIALVADLENAYNN